MYYKEYRISFPKILSEDESGLYIAELSDLEFESFQESGRDLLAYIGGEAYGRRAREIADYLDGLRGTGIAVEGREIEKQNWNSLWESHFEPIRVDRRCAVRAPFHAPTGAELEVVIMPKMSFGTGHHQTTRLMMEAILDAPVAGKACLDMGCGTAVLAILAVLRGAASADAVDIDEWAYENGVENCAANGVSDRVRLFCGDASLLGERDYDLVFANINRNILLKDMGAYAAVLRPGGEIFFSGFLEEDVPAIAAEGERQGLRFVRQAGLDQWRMVAMKKEG